MKTPLRSLVLASLTFLTSASFAQTSAHATKAARKAHSQPSEVQQLRDLISAQQRQLEDQRAQMQAIQGQLQELLTVAQKSDAAAQKAQESADQAQAAVLKAQQTATQADSSAAQASDNAIEAKTALALVSTTGDEQGKRLGSLESTLSHFRFAGDIRLRGESIIQDCARCVDRNRARIRVRFGLEGKLNEDFLGGFSIATGSLGDPVSSNETLTNFLNRKTIALDRGYITYAPRQLHWLQLTGGKFAYSWTRTSATLDPDINPEGFAEKFSFDFPKKTPLVKNVNFQAFQLLLNENRTSADAFAVGGQVGGKLDFGFFTMTPSFTLLNFHNADQFLAASAFAVQAATGSTQITIPPSTTPTTITINTPGEGPGCGGGAGVPTTPPCSIASGGMTNATFLDPVTKKPRFLSRFLYADLILNNQFKTGSARLPFNLLLEYETNLNAADHPLDSSGSPTTLGKQSHAYFIEASLGQNRNKGDVQFGYAFQRQEQDSILASFAESEQRAPTNILQHRLFVNYRVRSNTTAAVTYWIGRTLNSALVNAALAPGLTAGTQEPYLRRIQFDLIYTF